MARANNSKLFSNDAFKLPTLRGFNSNTSMRYMSVQNESNRATLYRPALKALIAYRCEGRKVWDETMTYNDVYQNNNGIVAAIAKVGTCFVAEYRETDDITHLAVFDTSKKQFLFAGITEDNGDSYSSYVLDYKDGRNGTVLWLALMPYLENNVSEELNDVFKNLNHLTIGVEYKKLVKGDSNVLPSYVTKYCYIFCDNIYYTVDRAGNSNEVEVNIPKSGVFPRVPDDVKTGTYHPGSSPVVGKFSLKGFASSDASTQPLEVSSNDLFCKYPLNENMTDDEKANIPQMPDWYVVPTWVLKAAHNVKYNHDLPLSASIKQNNLFLFGPPGSGKSDGSKAIASALGLQFTHISMSANSDEFIFTGNIIPEVEGLSESTQNNTELDIFKKYKDLSEILEYAELSPEIVYTDITGEDKTDASVTDVIEAYAQYIASERIRSTNQSSNGVTYKFVESDFCKAIENGWLVTIEEFTNVRDAGIAMVINQLMDGYQMITLPTGKVIKRHPNSVIVFASNVDEAQCGEFEASTLSRLKPMYRIESPSKGDMIKRVRAMTGFKDSNTLEIMANVVEELQKYIEDHALVGVCGVREFAGWCLQHQANLAFDSNSTLSQAALETIVPSASPHKEDIDDIVRDVINTMLV